MQKQNNLGIKALCLVLFFFFKLNCSLFKKPETQYYVLINYHGSSQVETDGMATLSTGGTASKDALMPVYDTQIV